GRRGEGQSAGNVCAEIKEGCKWRRIRIRRKGSCRRFDDHTTAIVAVVLSPRRNDSSELLWQRITIGSDPDARQIGLTVGRTGSFGIHNHAAFGIAWNARLLELRPLREK